MQSPTSPFFLFSAPRIICVIFFRHCIESEISLEKRMKTDFKTWKEEKRLPTENKKKSMMSTQHTQHREPSKI